MMAEYYFHEFCVLEFKNIESYINGIQITGVLISVRLETVTH